MKRGLIVTLMLMTLFQVGCYHAIVRGGPRSPMFPEARTGINWAWGLSSAEFDIADCPYGLAQVETYFPWYTVFVRIVTIGIVTPHKIRYVCAQPSAGVNYYQPPAPYQVPPPPPAPAQ